MNRLILLVSLLVCATACEHGRDLPVIPTQPTVPVTSPPPPAPPAPTSPRIIMVGEEVKTTFTGSVLAFDLTAPRAGTLIATVTWDPWYNESLLVLSVQGTDFKPAPPAWSPVSGKLQVVAGETYRLEIKPGGTGWWYNDAFVLTTSME